ncbi:MAG TPA: right-handed parallel beta-helix repeat-containing protein, partial [Tenuifilaceae bacterium]|nr:right-handed parallel beta-helix repeat-containing protein [Tenuifilaceae bacterium]
KSNFMKKFLLPAFMLFALAFTSCDLFNPDDDDDVILITESITTPTTWLGSKTYVVETGIDIDGTTLTIEPGTTIKFKSGAYLSFGWSDNVTLIANGTEDKPIVFTAYASNPAPGSWEGLWFYGSTLSNSSMTYCEIQYAGQNDHPAVNLDEKITMNNCKIQGAKKIGIYAAKGFVSFSGNTIENVGTHAIEIESLGVTTLGSNNTITCESNYGIKVRGGDINTPTATITEQTVPYYIDGAINVEQTLTIQPGVVLKFHADTWIDFGYYESTTLNAVGTEEKPIIFTTAASTPAPGAWHGVFFYSHTTSNTLMKHCIVEYAGDETDNANISIYEVDGLTIEDCTIRYSSGWGIFSWYSSFNDNNNTYTDNALGDVSINN